MNWKSHDSIWRLESYNHRERFVVDPASFAKVDQSIAPVQFIQYLDTVNRMETVHAYKLRTFELLDVKQGYRVLDVGCGTGDDVRLLAHMTGNDGLVVGVDNSAVMLAEARRRSEGLNLPVEYCLADAGYLSFANDSFNACRSDRTFQHLEDPREAFAEMVRVTRSGGHIVIFEPDWETLVMDVADRSLARKMVNFLCDSFQTGWIGRRLLALFKSGGLQDITALPITNVLTDYSLATQVFRFQETAERAICAGVVTETEATTWLQTLEASGQAGYFFSAVTGFVVSGRKP
jgi:ubiquinone/menaquinone biosynthesis C-methylase UbiE